MNNIFRHSIGSPLPAVLALVCALGMANQVMAQATLKISSPATPTIITPPEGNSAFLLGRATGTQGYVCLPTANGGASWTVNGARPEATLFTTIFGKPVEIITHFLSPNTKPFDSTPRPIPFGNATWQSSIDSSMVWAAVPNANILPAGPENASCPNSGSIACLLLQAVGNQEGPAGGSFMTQVTFIQRLNTNGGSAPAEGCSETKDVGKQALVPYTADYYFFHASK